MLRLFAILVFAIPAHPVHAGAWLREKDSVFAALSVTSFPGDFGDFKSKGSFYAEWGARPSLTIGLDAEEHQDLYGHALVFGRMQIANLGNAGRFAGEFGLGVHHQQRQSWALYKLGLSYGKGLETRIGNGWLAVDTALEYRSHQALLSKLDVTVGLSSNRRLDPLLQIETTYVSGQSLYWSARPSIMFRPREAGTWVVGIERNSYQSRTGLKFALWHEF